MVSVTLNGKPYQCASCKEELTIGQYQRILKEWGIDQEDLTKRNNLGLFNILTGTDFKTAEVDTESEQAIYEIILWCFTEAFQYSKELPKVLDIGGKVIDIPNRVGGCSIGQNIILKQLIDSSKYVEETISMATAIYLQPEYSGGKFDYAKAKELEKVISEMPASLVYPIGFFLLNRAATTGQKPHGIWHRMKNSLSLH
jgi:hypothetical protein